MALDVNALVQKAKADAAAAEAAAEKAKADAEAKKAKTAAADRIQVQANQKFDYAKNLKASLQNIEDEIMGYVTRLSRGDKLSKQEQSRLDSLGKQYDKVSKNYTTNLNQGNALLAKIPKEAKPSVPSTAEKGKVEEKKAELRDYAAEITTAGQAIAEMSKKPGVLLGLSTSLSDAGYKVTPSDNYNDTLISAYIQAIADNQTRSRNFNKEIPFKEFLQLRKGEGGAGAGAGAGGPSTQVGLYPSITNEQDGRITINKYFQDKFGRDATDAEFKSAYADVVKQQKASPVKRVQVTDAKGNITYTTTGGTNTEQILNDFVAKKPKLQDEATAYESVDAATAQRAKDRKSYEKLAAAAAGDPNKMAALANTAYGKDLAYVRRKVEEQGITAGANLTAEQIDAITKEAVDQAQDRNIYQLKSFIDSKLQFGPKAGVYTGVAGETVDTLTKVAAANGLDLQKVFGAQLPDWLSAINKGESVETYKKAIREVAKLGMPEKVAKLLDQGIDLSAIYAPYKNLMATTLEINPASIDMNDSTLRSAITADKEIPLYDFERQLRKDDRWQYTKQANQEVADITRKVLQDFGFMG